MPKQAKGSLQLTLTALIWGVAFVAQSVGMDYVGPWTFNCVRNILASIILIPIIFLVNKLENKPKEETFLDPQVRKSTIRGGIICGLFLCSASMLQQYGITESSVGKAGFITALYIIIVPFLSLFLHKKIGWNAWVSAVVAVTGFYIMSISGKPSIEHGDILLLACAFLFSLQILAVDKYVTQTDAVGLSWIQFIVSAVISFAGMMIFERPAFNDILAAWLPIMYAGIMSSGVAYTLQIIGQKNVEPALASLLMSLESVFSALAGWVILGQVLSPKERIGCCLVFAGVILAQLPLRASTTAES